MWDFHEIYGKGMRNSLTFSKDGDAWYFVSLRKSLNNKVQPIFANQKATVNRFIYHQPNMPNKFFA
jgi:hypothetical protein